MVRFPRKPSNSGCLLFSFSSFCFLFVVYYYASPDASETVPALREKPAPKPDYRAEKMDFHAENAGVMVFLHIQKTGGTEFGRHLLFLDVGKRCIVPTRANGREKKTPRGSKCYRPGQSKGLKEDEMWLFSRFTRGWPCGVHADWTELHECVEKTLEDREGQRERQFFYITMLREPVSRFISEFAHVNRGATWASPRHCNNRVVSKKQLPDCYPGFSEKRKWPNLTIENFLSCKSNLGINRQTRMLADLKSVDCYNMKKFVAAVRDRKILTSAKVNLRSLPYFGLNEYQIESKELFEYTFGLKFTDEFHARDQNQSKSYEFLEALSERDIQRIKEVNYLDMELYDYAKEIFLERVQEMRRNATSLRYYWQQYLLVDSGVADED